MNNAYNNSIKDTLRSLVEARQNLFTAALGIAMNGALSEINDVFEVGEKYSFSLEHLEGTSDTNLNLVVDLIKRIQATAESLANLNALDIDAFIKGEI